MKPDILIIMSDQHAASCTGYMGNNIVETPNLDRLAENGTVFENAYTTCPICVPARLSFMTGNYPYRGGWFDNDYSMGDNQATFMHSITLAGYETVLCGRMHFIGEDQKHGFSKRIMGDFTVNFPGGHEERRRNHGAYESASQSRYCLRYVGGNDITPVLEYDDAVMTRAKEYLSKKHDTPQCLLVGTFGPHFPFVAPKEYFMKYRNIIDKPQNEARNFDMHPMYYKYEKLLTEDTLIKDARAAYYGLVENMDRQIGELLETWEKYLEKNNKTGIVVYLSDHGESCGEKTLFGKMNFFDSSAKIPLIFSGKEIKKGSRINQPVSIMDVGATLCNLVGADAPQNIDGKELSLQVKRGIEDSYRMVLSEYMEVDNHGLFVPGRMIRYRNWKLIRYKGYENDDLLFDLKNDPGETINLHYQNPNEYKLLVRMLEEEWDPKSLCYNYSIYKSNINVISKWNRSMGKVDSEVWKISEKAAAPIEKS